MLGIARRKAGQQVTCPTCHKPLTVPATDDPDLSPEGGVPAPASPPVAVASPLKRDVFERSDFDLDLPRAVPRPAPVETPAAAPPAPAPVEAGRGSQVAAPATAQPGGIVLTPTQATILTVTAILLLAVAFGVGLLVGRFLI